MILQGASCTIAACRSISSSRDNSGGGVCRLFGFESGLILFSKLHVPLARFKSASMPPFGLWPSDQGLWRIIASRRRASSAKQLYILSILNSRVLHSNLRPVFFMNLTMLEKGLRLPKKFKSSYMYVIVRQIISYCLSDTLSQRTIMM